MAKVHTEIKTICDICKQELDSNGKKDVKLSVIFTTEQTEGRSCTPYLSLETLDLCKHHYDNLMRGKMIFAHGAMGYNTYHF